jgi:hypothetical protein
LKNKYFLSASLRQDKSPLYNLTVSPHFFPSYEAAWKIINEKFLQHQPVFSELKLRVGYGITGRLFETNSANSTIILRPNPSTHGEKLTEKNIGLDLGFLANRLLFQADYYHRTTHNLLMQQTFSFTQDGSIKINEPINKLQNKGWELLLKSQPILSENFNWNTNLTFSVNKNELLYDSYMPYTNLTKGQPVGVLYGYKLAGLTNDMEAIFLNKLGKEIGYQELKLEDKIALGYGSPNNFLGFVNSFTFKNVDLTMNLRGAFGFQIWNFHRYKYMDLYIDSNRSYNVFSDVLKLDTSILNKLYQLRDTDYFIEKGDFVKIDNLTLGYTLLGNISFIQHARLYLSGNNLFTFTKFKGSDPEMAGIMGTGPGLYTSNVYPVARIYVVGADITF